MKKTKEKNQRFFSSSIFSKSRRGFFLAEETLKIIIAILVIAFLIYFLVSLYLSSNDSEEMQFAESSVKHITEQMNLQAAEIMIYNPENWVLLSWKEGQLPDFCSNIGWKNCLCICEDKNSCAENGYCTDYNKEIFIKDGSILLDNLPISLQLNYGNKIEVNKK